MTPPLRIAGAALRRGDRDLWSGLDLEVAPGELIAVLGPSGSGKTTLLRAILGLEPLSAGTIEVLGQPVHGKGSRRIGYIPQQRPLPRDTSLRGRDLVTLGVDGHRFGLPIPRRGDRARVDALLAAVGAEAFADKPVGVLSGGEQQRLRVGQALADDPRLLLCDEPLTSLDLANQQAVIGLIDRHRRDTGAAVLLVTHDINPLLGKVDRIVAAWRTREDVERYAAVVPRARLRENGFNLNIPRYVDTFEAEEAIDVAAVQREIEALEAQLAATRVKMGGYLRELGVVA